MRKSCIGDFTIVLFIIFRLVMAWNILIIDLVQKHKKGWEKSIIFIISVFEEVNNSNKMWLVKFRFEDSQKFNKQAVKNDFMKIFTKTACECE